MTAFISRARVLLAFTFLAATAGSATAQPTSAKALADENAVLLETVGLLAGVQLYQAYLNIGLLADGYAEGLYESAEAAQLLGSVVGPLEKIEKQLEKVAVLKLTKDDAAAIMRMKKIAGLLRSQGKSLQSYWDTDAEGDSKKYEETRQAAWKELSDLLELEPKKKTTTGGTIVIEPKKP
jgi:hypothetical protein